MASKQLSLRNPPPVEARGQLSASLYLIHRLLLDVQEVHYFPTHPSLDRRTSDNYKMLAVFYLDSLEFASSYKTKVHTHVIPFLPTKITLKDQCYTANY
jgi:hypothetical protein